MKDYGADRMVSQGSELYEARRQEAERLKQSGLYSVVEFNEASGGIYAEEKSKKQHYPEEREAARFMAQKGYVVTLKDEAGSVITPDGYIFSYSFEMKTPEKASVKNALQHARSKRADVAVIYDKYQRYNKKGIEDGINSYERFISNQHRFKRIIVISKVGNVYEHYHNDTNSQFVI